LAVNIANMSSGENHARRRRAGHRGAQLFAVGLGAILVGVAAWGFRFALLQAVGEALTRESELASVDVLVVSVAAGPAGALEAVDIYRRRSVRRIVMATWPGGPADDAVRDLGVPLLRPGEVAREVLLRGGVAPEAITVLPHVVNGTGAEVPVIASFVRDGGVTSLLYLTARSHTARAWWLLRRVLPPTVELLVRSPSRDVFEPGGWWQDRESTREVVTEVLHWAGEVVVPDPWGDFRK
jgi:uncharacterized SAM-binding protein YcdF (DUF218 family)